MDFWSFPIRIYSERMQYGTSQTAPYLRSLGFELLPRYPGKGTRVTPLLGWSLELGVKEDRSIMELRNPEGTLVCWYYPGSRDQLHIVKPSN